MILKDLVAKLYTKQEEEPSVTEDELNVIIDTMEEEGAIESDEVELINNILDLNDREVKDIMTPRPDIIAIEDDMDVDEIKNIFFTNYLLSSYLNYATTTVGTVCELL